MAHANCGCKWYINKPLLSQAKPTAEENVHTHITIPVTEWTEIKILLPQAISRGLWKRNCNKLAQKKLNLLQTGQHTHWQGGNRGVSIKINKVMFDMQLSCDKVILGTGEKVEKNPFSQAVNWCQWYREQHCKQRALVPLALAQGVWQQGHLGMAQPGAALGSEQLWVLLQRLRDHQLQTTLSGEARGKKKSQLSQNRARKDWKNILFTIWKIPGIQIQTRAVNRATSTQN